MSMPLSSPSSNASASPSLLQRCKLTRTWAIACFLATLLQPFSGVSSDKSDDQFSLLDPERNSWHVTRSATPTANSHLYERRPAMPDESLPPLDPRASDSRVLGESSLEGAVDVEPALQGPRRRLLQAYLGSFQVMGNPNLQAAHVCVPQNRLHSVWVCLPVWKCLDGSRLATKSMHRAILPVAIASLVLTQALVFHTTSTGGPDDAFNRDFCVHDLQSQNSIPTACVELTS